MGHPQHAGGIDSSSLETMLLTEWIVKHGVKGLHQLVDIMFTTYCEDPIWNWECSKEAVERTVRKFLDIPECWIVAIRYEGELVSYGIGYRFEHYEMAGAMLGAFDDRDLAATVQKQGAFLIDTISTVPRYQGNGAMKLAFAELQLIASSKDYPWLISWTSADNLTERLSSYFSATGRRAVGTFEPPGYPQKSVVLLKKLKV